MACVDGYTKHNFGDSDVCKRCGVPKPERYNPSEEGTDATGYGSLADMEAQAENPSPQPPKPKATKRVKGRASAQVSEEEKALKDAINTATAKSVVELGEFAKRTVAQNLMGLDWSASELTPQESSELTSCLQRYLQSIHVDLSSPTYVLAVLLMTEVRITMRQFASAAPAIADKETVN